MSLHGNPENAALHSGVEITITNKKHDGKKKKRERKKSNLQSQALQLKQESSLSVPWKKDA